MTGPLETGLTRDDGERRALAEVLHETLQFGADVDTWLPRYDGMEMIVVRRGGRVMGGGILVPMGQWFGGRSVPMIALHAVGVLPEARGGGVGTALVHQVVREIHARGAALSTLYPATVPLYRRGGYEQAGMFTRYKIALAGLGAADRELDVERVGEDALDDLRTVYRRVARWESGLVDRQAWAWRRMLEWPPSPVVHTFRARRAGVTEGYVIFRQRPGPTPLHGYDLECRELVATSPAAARRLVTLLGDHASLSQHVFLHAGPSTPLLSLIPDRRYEVEWQLRWMLRVIDVERALTDRGYAPQLAGRVTLQVDDDLVPSNRDRFTLEVERGSARVTRGGEGGLRIRVRGMAALYTGYMTASQLVTAGLADGTPEEVAAATALFAGPMPWLPEIF